MRNCDVCIVYLSSMTMMCSFCCRPLLMPAQAEVPAGRNASKGLRHFSMKVCEKVESKGRTTYNEVADELVRDFSTPPEPGETPSRLPVRSSAIDMPAGMLKSSCATSSHRPSPVGYPQSAESNFYFSVPNWNQAGYVQLPYFTTDADCASAPAAFSSEACACGLPLVPVLVPSSLL